MTRPFVQLRAHGVGIVIDTPEGGLPRVLHWGEDLGALSDADLEALGRGVSRQTAPGTLDAAWHLSLSPQESDGWTGRPGMQLRRDGVLHYPRWVESASHAENAAFVLTARDEASALVLEIRIAIEAGGVVWTDAALRHDGAPGAPAVEVEWLESTLPVPSTTSNLTTFDGRWSREKRPVTIGMPPGSTARQTRRGRGGHDHPMMFIASEGEPRWGDGRVWGVHLAWSSDSTYRLDRVSDAATVLGAGELLRPGELVLEPGDEYAAPRTAFVFSEEGLDGLSGRVHRWLRARDRHPRTARPLTLNTWEAVYFDHRPAELIALAELAASVGIERFVLDDGWFLGRRDDTTSLGDWVVDRSVWPDGLAPLAERVHELGMEFGLWFEPEMVSLDSDLARAHPEWLLHNRAHVEAGDPALSWRSQYVLDLADAGAYAHVLGQIDALVAELGIDFIKWDHNRDLVESVHDGRPGLHAQMVAVYALMAELKSRHPGLEIESCSSGGARTDLGVMAICDRVWASDSNDPVERQDIQRWTGLLLPPELVGAHVGPTESHSSGRTTDLSYRMATSLMGSAGFEWDISGCDEAELATITSFAGLYKELRPLLHSATVVHPDIRDAAWRVTGYVADDRAAAVYIVATVSAHEDARVERLRLSGLDAERSYRVRVRREIGEARGSWIVPEWFSAGEITLPGSVLARVGLQLPALWPMQAFVLHATAV